MLHFLAFDNKNYICCEPRPHTAGGSTEVIANFLPVEVRCLSLKAVPRRIYYVRIRYQETVIGQCGEASYSRF